MIIFKNLHTETLIIFLISILVAIVLIIRQNISDKKVYNLFTSQRLRNRYLQNFYPSLRKWHTILFATTIVLSALFFWEPSWGKRKKPLIIESLDLLFVIDISRSMDAQDIQPSRLEYTKQAMKIIAQNLEGQRVGIIAFANSAFYYCPMTHDYESFLEFTEALNSNVIPDQGSNVQDVFKKVSLLFQNNKATSKVIFFFSDGEFHQELPAQSFTDINGKPVPTYIFGVGTKQGGKINIPIGYTKFGQLQYKQIHTKLNESKLKDLSAHVNGTYMNIQNSYESSLQVIQNLKSYKKQIIGSKVGFSYKSRLYIFAVFLSILYFISILLHIWRKKEVKEHV